MVIAMDDDEQKMHMMLSKSEQFVHKLDPNFEFTKTTEVLTCLGGMLYFQTYEAGDKLVSPEGSISYIRAPKIPTIKGTVLLDVHVGGCFYPVAILDSKNQWWVLSSTGTLLKVTHEWVGAASRYIIHNIGYVDL